MKEEIKYYVLNEVKEKFKLPLDNVNVTYYALHVLQGKYGTFFVHTYQEAEKQKIIWFILIIINLSRRNKTN